MEVGLPACEAASDPRGGRRRDLTGLPAIKTRVKMLIPRGSGQAQSILRRTGGPMLMMNTGPSLPSASEDLLEISWASTQANHFCGAQPATATALSCRPFSRQRRQIQLEAHVIGRSRSGRVLNTSRRTAAGPGPWSGTTCEGMKGRRALGIGDQHCVKRGIRPCP